MADSDDRAAIARASATLLNSVNAGDVAGVVSVWANDGELLPPNQPPIHGRQNIEAYFRNLFTRSRLEFAFTSSAVEIFGDVALERVNYVSQVWRSGSPTSMSDRGTGLHVYRRESTGAWALIYDIWNSDGAA